jgi:hypothetical protein
MASSCRMLSRGARELAHVQRQPPEAARARLAQQPESLRYPLALLIGGIRDGEDAGRSSN